MAIAIDFSSTDPPKWNIFLCRTAVMLGFWICALSAVDRAVRYIATIFWSRPAPVEAASIPSRLPHPNPPGGAIPFDIPIPKATDDQISAFMSFRGRSHSGGEAGALQAAADCAAVYKGALYEERALKWIDDHFRLRLPGIKYPYVGRHWNGWSSMWTETGPRIREMFIASVVIVFEHSVNGFILPCLYLLTHNNVYYNLALYGEVAYMVYATSMIGASYYFSKDVTLEQMHRSVWPMLLAHHVSSMMLSVGCILIGGDGVPRDLVCGVLLALLGLTSSLHYVGQVLDFSPLAQSNAPYTRLCNHVFCLASQVLFRVVYWIRLFYVAVLHCLESHGTGMAATVALILFLFTLFNADFVKFHLKATKGCWLRIQQDAAGKNC